MLDELGAIAGLRSKAEAELLRRHRAIEKTRAKYDGRPIDFVVADCVRMLRSHLVAMGRKKLPPLPRYSTPAGGMRALRKAGFATVEALVDSLLPRIAPAAMWPGDIALMEGTDGFDAVTICVGHKLYGWHEQNELREPVMIVPAAFKAAYRA